MQKLTLAPHQIVGKKFIINQPITRFQKKNGYIITTNEGKALFFEMGAGKTVTTLSALYDLNPKGNVLIIAPLEPALTTWYDEVAKWGFPFRIKSFLVNEKGKNLSKEKREKLLEEIISGEIPPTVYIINKEKIPWLIKTLPKKRGIPQFPFPYVVIDELHNFKSPMSKTFKDFIKVRPQIKWIIGLTGTPLPNSLLDIWSQIYLLDQGKRLGTNYYSFREKYFYPSIYKDDRPVKFEPYPESKGLIFKKIHDIALSAKNTKKLPDLIQTIDYVHMDDTETAIYKEFKKELVLPFGEDQEIIAKNSAILQMKLSQYASGCLYTNENRANQLTDDDYIVCHKRKIDYIRYLISNIQTPVLISYYYKTDARELLKAFPNAVIFDSKDNTMISKWNNDKIPILLLHSNKAEGLNLQYGSCQHLIWYSLSFNLTAYQQVNTRLYRTGQTRTIYIHHVLTKGTIDEYILRKLKKKDTTQKALIDSVKMELERK